MPERWPWQDEAVDFCRDRVGSVLNMHMGTGKSRVNLDLLREWGVRRALVVGPLSTVSPNAWGSQFEQYCPGARVALLDRGGVPRKAARALDNLREAHAHGRLGVNVVNFESLWRPKFARHCQTEADYEAIIVDESHKAKAPRGKASLFLYRLGAQVRSRRGGGRVLLNTGTLMPHSPMDAFAQFRIFDPSVFGTSFVRFRARYAVMGGFENRQILGFQNMDELRAKMAPHVFQVGREVLQHDEPIVSTVHVELGAEAARAYARMERTMVADIAAGRMTAANGLVKLLRLQQLTSGSFVPDGEGAAAVEVDDAKRAALTEILEGTSNEPVVVFGRFSCDLDNARRACADAERPYYELSGRARELEAWDMDARAHRDSDTSFDFLPGAQAPVLGVQIQAGGSGINLTAAGIGVYVSTGFFMGDFEQSMARLDRPGRQPQVRFIHIIARNTIDVTTQRAFAARTDVVEAALRHLNELRGAA